MGLALTQLYFFQTVFLCRLNVRMWWQTFPAHIEYDAAEWLQRNQKLEAWTVETWATDPGPGRAGAKRRRYLEAMWLLAVDDDSLWVYVYPHRSTIMMRKEAFLL